MHAYTHGGWAHRHWLSESAQHFWLRKTLRIKLSFSCAPDWIQTWVMECVVPTSYQLSHPVLTQNFCNWKSLPSWALKANYLSTGFIQDQGKLEKSGKIRKRFPVTKIRKSENIDYSQIIVEFENSWVENQYSAFNPFFEAEKKSYRNNYHWVIEER